MFWRLYLLHHGTPLPDYSETLFADVLNTMRPSFLQGRHSILSIRTTGPICIGESCESVNLRSVKLKTVAFSSLKVSDDAFQCIHVKLVWIMHKQAHLLDNICYVWPCEC